MLLKEGKKLFFFKYFSEELIPGFLVLGDGWECYLDSFCGLKLFETLLGKIALPGIIHYNFD